MIAGTSCLELAKGDRRILAPAQGMFGPVTLRGNAIPDFSYLVFDEALMEFPEVNVILSLPDRVTFAVKTPDLGEVPLKPEYAKPFWCLLKQLHQYFPLLTEKKDVIHVG